jgi:hypothetical protein
LFDQPLNQILVVISQYDMHTIALIKMFLTKNPAPAKQGRGAKVR